MVSVIMTPTTLSSTPMAFTLIVPTSLTFALMASTTLAYAHHSYWLAFIKGNIIIYEDVQVVDNILYKR